MRRTLKFLINLVNHMRELVRKWARTKLAQCLDLRFDIGCISREFRQQCGHLSGHDPAQTHQQKACRRHREQHREKSLETSSFQHSNDRVQQEGQQNRQGDRDHNRTSPLQTNHDNQPHEGPRQDNQGTLPERSSAISDYDLFGFVIGLTARQSIRRNN